MICKKCNPVMNHKLIQSGQADPKSYICSVCDAYHDSNGNLYDPDAKVQSNETKCDACGSTDLVKYPVTGIYVCCKCGFLGDYESESWPKAGAVQHLQLAGRGKRVKK